MFDKTNKVIPIKHGSPYDNTEAFANLETGEVEHSTWDEGPSNNFNSTFSGGRIVSGPPSKAYEANYARIFKHD